eukprot:5557421-Alexandrium_andersonii.AAC.1
MACRAAGGHEPGIPLPALGACRGDRAGARVLACAGVLEGYSFHGWRQPATAVLQRRRRRRQPRLQP